MAEKNTENLDSQNEEQENDDSQNVEESTEENTEESKDESENESEDNSDEESQDEYTEREKQLYARLKKAEGFVQDGSGKWVKPTKKPVKKETKTTASDEVTLSRLEVRGVMEPEDQDYVLRFAKNEGISPIEALSDDIVKDRLSANKRQRESANATPRSNNRANNQVDEVDSYVRKYKRAEADGKDPGSVLPENNPALTSKILSKLKGA